MGLITNEGYQHHAEDPHPEPHVDDVERFKKHQTVWCPRCELDVLVYGVAYFNSQTKEHYDVHTIVRRNP